MAAGSPRPARKGPLVPGPPSCAQAPQLRGRLAHSPASPQLRRVGVHSPGSGRTAWLAASWEVSRGAHELGIPHPASSLQPAVVTQGTLFLSKPVLHICSAAAGQGSRSGPAWGDETSSDSPGHVCSELPPARTPPPQGRPGRPPPARLSLPLRIPSVSVSFCLPTHADVETWKIFTQPKVPFPEQGSKFLLSWGRRADAPRGCMGPPSQPVPNRRGNTGKSPVRSEPARRGCGGSVPTDTTAP